MHLIALKSPRLEGTFEITEAISTALLGTRESLREGDVLIISSKVVALAEGRIAKISEIVPSAAAKKRVVTRYGTGKEDPRIVELVMRESDAIMPGKMLIALKDGNFLPSAGIDLSNAPDDTAILLPKNSWQSAWNIRNVLQKKYKLKKLGVIIIDSRCQPLRWGTVGIALGWAGFEGIEDARGQKDLYGKKLKVTRKAVADNLASAAEVVMGESGESTPFVLVRNAPIKFTHLKPDPKKLRIAPKDCIFEGIYGTNIKNPSMFRIAVLASTRGTDLQAIIDEIRAGRLNVDLACVISNKENCYAIQRAREHGFTTFFVDPADKSREEFDRELADLLKQQHIDLIVLVGYMRILTPEFVREFPRKIINVHPSLLPKYGGKDFYNASVHEAVLKSGDHETGMTIHYIDEGIDTGDIILQKKCPVYPNDTVATLKERVQNLEKEWYPKVIGILAAQ